VSGVLPLPDAAALPDAPPPADVRPARRAARPGLVLAWLVIAIAAVAAVRPSLLATASPYAIDPLHPLAGPSRAHWLGTDQLGRDLYSRIIYGARPSLLIGLGATALAVALGGALGVLAAAGGRVVRPVIMRVNDILLAFPGLLLALLVVAVLGSGSVNVMLAIGLSMTPGFARLTLSMALSVQASEYTEAAVVLGRRRPDIYLRHVLPNALAPVLALATVHIGTAIIGVSSLSFLGLGPQPPSPEWGTLLADSQDYVQRAWTIAVFPGLAIVLVVIALNVAGAHLRLRFAGRSVGVVR
jgi:peptide/nickel transport system permease protein